ncbi:TPA: PH domain-containing protein [Burkholderia cepacia ATCC 25416]|jgi:membrane protein YdbS with pleckstrin-like domain|uniref:PH domain-containing protein n=2 Tax=Burkholderia cepacia complex TaxID=87882 RepID=A0AAP4VMR4_9BURK|nr:MULTISPECIES: PH domain-containing protein [Burkholderia]HDR9767753.1 PH domain-containing protein [Burkholderia cepacia ATCC 25416]MBA9834258.1 PH domain-containing protein [Burkholderia contaminans]MBD1415181.1 PH domain-containing protein [Burkholderia contaminans]MBH9694124.1 PH domain-containing protein [Burkholderia contaminans]MBM6431282.1 PH domain-containing protein [Burkholderia contaminans]
MKPTFDPSRSPAVSPPWFEASPVWTVNLPLIVNWAIAEVVLLLLVAGAAAVTNFWWVFALVLFVPIGAVLQAIAQTRATRFVIDASRVTVTRGLVMRETISVELARVQNIQALALWWQERMGFGSLRFETSDMYHPVWVLHGIPDAVVWRDYLTRYTVALREARGIRDVNIGRL